MEHRKDLFTIDEIDGLTSLGSPHKKELKEIGERKIEIFRNLNKENLENITTKIIGGKLEKIELEEDWTITKEFFPKAYIHISYFYYGNEFGDSEIDKFKFIFSGERIRWIPGEDLSSFIDIIMNYVERELKGKTIFKPEIKGYSDMLKKAIYQRQNPFKFIEDEDIPILATFIGGTYIKNEEFWELNKEVFPGMTIKIKYSKENELLPTIFGIKTEKLENYEKDLLRIFIINHILRYITIKNDERELPEICKKMFSSGYLKMK